MSQKWLNRCGMGAARRRGAWLTLMAVAVLAGGAIALRRQPGASGPAGTGAGPDRSATSGQADLSVARVMSFDITTTASGELEARRQIEIRNPLEQATTITEVVKEGTQVKQGDVLVRLNSDTLQQQVDEEALRVESARADHTVALNNYTIQVSENASNLSKAQVAVEVAELELRKWQDGEVKSKRQENELAVEKAKRELDRLKEKYELGVSLEKKGFLSRDELKRDEVAYLEADAALKTALLDQRVYDEYTYPKDMKVKQSDLAQAKAELERVKTKGDSELASKDADRKNKQEELRIREQRLSKLREQLEATTIRAPQDGLVVYDSSLSRDRWGMSSSTVLDVGVSVTKNQRLMVLPDTSEMVAAVRVQESLAGRMKPGLTASVRIDALGGRVMTGKVDSVGVIAESGGMRDPNLREYTVRILLAESDPRLKPSMRCEAVVNVDRVADALSVPVQAVFFADDVVRYVLVPAGANQFTRRPVLGGRRSDRFIEIRAGLQAGESVLVRAAKPGEVGDEPWDPQQLAAVGLKLRADGRPEYASPGGPMGGGGMGGGRGGPPGGGRPGGQGSTGESGKPGPAAKSPESSAPATAAQPNPSTTPAKPPTGG